MSGRCVTSSQADESKTKLTQTGTGAGVEWFEREEVEGLVCGWPAVGRGRLLARTTAVYRNKERLFSGLGCLAGLDSNPVLTTTVLLRRGLVCLRFVLPSFPDATTCSLASVSLMEMLAQ